MLYLHVGTGNTSLNRNTSTRSLPGLDNNENMSDVSDPGKGTPEGDVKVAEVATPQTDVR